MSFIICFEVIVNRFSYKIALHFFKQKFDRGNWNNWFKSPKSSPFLFFKLQTMVFQRWYIGFVKWETIKELKLSLQIFLCVKVSDLFSSQIVMLSREIWSTRELEIDLLAAFLFYTLLFLEPLHSVSASLAITLRKYYSTQAVYTIIFVSALTESMKRFKICKVPSYKIIGNLWGPLTQSKIVS